MERSGMKRKELIAPSPKDNLLPVKVVSKAHDIDSVIDLCYFFGRHSHLMADCTTTKTLGQRDPVRPPLSFFPSRSVPFRSRHSRAYTRWHKSRSFVIVIASVLVPWMAAVKMPLMPPFFFSLSALSHCLSIFFPSWFLDWIGLDLVACVVVCILSWCRRRWR